MKQLEQIIIDLGNALKEATDCINREWGNDETVSHHYGYKECDIHHLEATIGRFDDGIICRCLNCGNAEWYQSDDVKVDDLGSHVWCNMCDSSYGF